MKIDRISWKDVEDKLKSIGAIKVEIREPRNSHNWELTKIIDRADVRIRLELDDNDNITGIVLEIYRRATF